MTALIHRIVAGVLTLMCFVACPPSLVFAQAPRKPDDPFLPLDKLPPTEQFPAAPLLVAAYVVVLVALFLYLVSVARRLSSVQREVERLEADVKRTGRA